FLRTLLVAAVDVATEGEVGRAGGLHDDAAVFVGDVNHGAVPAFDALGERERLFDEQRVEELIVFGVQEGGALETGFAGGGHVYGVDEGNAKDAVVVELPEVRPPSKR